MLLCGSCGLHPCRIILRFWFAFVAYINYSYDTSCTCDMGTQDDRPLHCCSGFHDFSVRMEFLESWNFRQKHWKVRCPITRQQAHIYTWYVVYTCRITNISISRCQTNEMKIAFDCSMKLLHICGTHQNLSNWIPLDRLDGGEDRTKIWSEDT